MEVKKEQASRARVVEAVKGYCEKQGYDDVTEYGGMVTFKHDGTLVFATIQYGVIGEGFPKEKVDREEFENVAAVYLAEHDTLECPIRFDNISILVVSDDRAMLRHHKDVVNACGFGLL